ncbi:hypothetical protein [Proteiniclasticum ruminis]|uniref:dTMP kinase n=1 Tax=Proteiniclasticum ruminis TaxID=398199 RepID=A0A1G8SBP1_9CLOT|nr:hypothetical protein [Proteiniclasticum ruminis]SDJ26638.1 dTMP kinase [Proteiniclasticum ruminis]
MITFSGIDGAGKTTQILLFEKYCVDNGIKFKKMWARGRCTPGVVLIKNIVRKDKNLNQKEKIEYRNNIHKSTSKRRLLLIASILDLYWFFGIYYRILDVLYPKFICDRYIWDTYIDFKVDYSEFNFENWLIWKLLLKLIIKPEESYVFVISAKESIRRGIQKKEAGMETIEQKTKKIQLYLELVHQGKWSKVIDGNQTIESIFNSIKKVNKYEY